MNPLLQSQLGSIIRAAILLAIPWLKVHGILTDSESVKFVESVTAVVLAVGWGLWAHYHKQKEVVTALASPIGTTQNDVREKIASGEPVPTVFTDPRTVPGVPVVENKP